MERRGVYRKGSAGHVRNINSYSFYKKYENQIRRFRLPLTALMALAIVFGTAPMVGEQLQTSLLTAEQTAKLENVDQNSGRKVVMDVLKEFVDDCNRFKIYDCAEGGEKILNDITGGKRDLSEDIFAVEQFAALYESKVARASCHYDLGEAFVQAQAAKNALESFTKDYGDVVDASLLKAEWERLNKTLEGLDKFVDLCASL